VAKAVGEAVDEVGAMKAAASGALPKGAESVLKAVERERGALSADLRHVASQLRHSIQCPVPRTVGDAGRSAQPHEGYNSANQLAKAKANETAISAGIYTIWLKKLSQIVTEVPKEAALEAHKALQSANAELHTRLDDLNATAVADPGSKRRAKGGYYITAGCEIVKCYNTKGGVNAVWSYAPDGSGNTQWWEQ
jgi:hypothetical protein